MIVPLARAYAFLLLAITGLLFSVSFVIHGFVLISGPSNQANFDPSVFKYSVFVGIASCGFMKNGLTWTQQVKCCPAWMWRSAFGLGLYTIGIAALVMILSQGSSFSIVFSAFPLASNAISFCLLYAVLWCRYLDEAQLAKAAGVSVTMVAVMAAVFLFHFAPK